MLKYNKCVHLRWSDEESLSVDALISLLFCASYLYKKKKGMFI